MRRVLLDTGPLVAYLNRRDSYHDWARKAMDALPPPLVTCEAVLTEALHLVRRLVNGSETILGLVERGVVEVDFRLAREIPVVRELMSRYADLPMSLADACLVRMSEFGKDTEVLTVDRDFTVYRRHGRRVIPLRHPEWDGGEGPPPEAAGPRGRSLGDA